MAGISANAIYETILPHQTLIQTCFGATLALQYFASPYLTKLTSNGKEHHDLKHIVADFALTPIRLALLYLAAPILLNLLVGDETWGQEQNSLIISAWVLLSIGYAFETSMTETSLISLVHHGIALSFTGLCAYASQEPSGRHVVLLRYTAFELVFAIAIGGMIGTVNRLAYSSIASGDKNVPVYKRNIVSAMTWSLVAVISLGWACKAIYLHQHSEQLYANFGAVFSLVLMAANVLIFAIQYKWIFMWGAKADRLSTRCGASKNINKTLRKIPLTSVFAGLSLGLGDLIRVWATLVLRV